MEKVILIICVLFLFGCSKEVRQKKRAIRKIEAAKRLCPELFENDTIVIVDTIKAYKSDTVTFFYKNDSVTVVNNDTVIVKYFYNEKTNEIHHEYECKEQIVTRDVVVEKIRKLSFFESLKIDWKQILILALALVVIMYMIKK